MRNTFYNVLDPAARFQVISVMRAMMVQFKRYEFRTAIIAHICALSDVTYGVEKHE